MCLNIVARQAWCALKPNIYRSKRDSICKHVFWMNVKFATCETKLHCMNLVSSTQKFNIFSQKIRDIRYNFVIGGDGNAYEGRGWPTDPLLPKKYGSLIRESLLVGFLGFFTIDVLPENMKKAANQLTDYGVHCGHIAQDYEFHDLLHPTEEPQTQEEVAAV